MILFIDHHVTKTLWVNEIVAGSVVGKDAFGFIIITVAIIIIIIIIVVSIPRNSFHIHFKNFAVNTDLPTKETQTT